MTRSGSVGGSGSLLASWRCGGGGQEVGSGSWAPWSQRQPGPGRCPGVAGRLGSCLPVAEHGRGRRAAAEARARPALRAGRGLGPEPRGSGSCSSSSFLPSFRASPPPFTFPEAGGAARAGRGGGCLAFIVGRTPRVRVAAPGRRGAGGPRRAGVGPAGCGRRCCCGPEPGACPATGPAARRLPALPCARLRAPA